MDEEMEVKNEMGKEEIPALYHQPTLDRLTYHQQ
jgi:hypothetical protein